MTDSQNQELKNCLLEIKNTSVTIELQINVMSKKDFLKNMSLIVAKTKRALEICDGV